MTLVGQRHCAAAGSRARRTCSWCQPRGRLPKTAIRGKGAECALAPSSGVHRRRGRCRTSYAGLFSKAGDHSRQRCPVIRDHTPRTAAIVTAHEAGLVKVRWRHGVGSRQRVRTGNCQFHGSERLPGPRSQRLNQSIRPVLPERGMFEIRLDAVKVDTTSPDNARVHHREPRTTENGGKVFGRERVGVTAVLYPRRSTCHRETYVSVGEAD